MEMLIYFFNKTQFNMFCYSLLGIVLTDRLDARKYLHKNFSQFKMRESF